MTNICLPMPTADEARATFGSDFNPDKTLNGAIALAAWAISQVRPLRS